MGGAKGSSKEVEELKAELTEQREMLWLLGEMMKSANQVITLKELMTSVVEVLKGVMGLSACYLWTRSKESEIDNYSIIYGSSEKEWGLEEKNYISAPMQLRHLEVTTLFTKQQIARALMEDAVLPGARLVIPLVGFKDKQSFGFFVIEHPEENFFSANRITFFETFCIYITSKALSAKKMAKISEQSIKDPLTGSYNRRYLNVAMDEMRKSWDNVTVAIIDIDNFKTINDELGHLEGDIVLKGLSQLALGLAKECDGEVIRYGGDEFVILIPKAKREALEILENFRIGVSYLKIAYHLKTHISVTLGMCTYPDMLDEYGEALVRAADNALLRGKVVGKNRIVLAQQEDMT